MSPTQKPKHLHEAQAARKEQVRRWVETRPRSVRLPSGREDKHPRKGHKNDWEQTNQEEE